MSQKQDASGEAGTDGGPFGDDAGRLEDGSIEEVSGGCIIDIRQLIDGPTVFWPPFEPTGDTDCR